MKKYLKLLIPGCILIGSLTQCTVSKTAFNNHAFPTSIFEDSQITEPVWQSKILEDYRPEDEIPERRTLEAKHFKINDTTVEVITLTAGNALHYKDHAGNWQTIDTRITENRSGKYSEYDFANTTNNFHTFYSSDITKGSILELQGGILKDGLNKKMVWLDENYNIVASTALSNRNNYKINGITVSYNEVFPNIDLVYTQNTMGRKMDYILQNREAIANAPANAKYLAFAEDVELSENLKLKTQEGDYEISILDSENNEMAYFNTPQHKDANDSTITCKYHTKNNTVFTLVPVSWLNNENRTFPVIIDPSTTVNVFFLMNAGNVQFTTVSGTLTISSTGNIGASNTNTITICRDYMTLGYYHYSASNKAEFSAHLGFNSPNTIGIPSCAQIKGANLLVNFLSIATGSTGNNKTYKIDRISGPDITTSNTATSWHNATVTYTFSQNEVIYNTSDIEAVQTAVTQINNNRSNNLTLSMKRNWTGTASGDNCLYSYNAASNAVPPALKITYSQSESSCYCTPVINNASDAAGITSVFLGDITHDSPSNLSSNGYLNLYNTHSTQLVRGETYTLSVGIYVGTSNYRHRQRAWIDWDQSYGFDDLSNNERYDLPVTDGTAATKYFTVTKSITVPLDAKLGETRMRVSTKYYDATPNPSSTVAPLPCETWGYGSSFDYKIIVVDPKLSCDTSFLQNGTGLNKTSGKNSYDDNEIIVNSSGASLNPDAPDGNVSASWKMTRAYLYNGTFSTTSSSDCLWNGKNVALIRFGIGETIYPDDWQAMETKTPVNLTGIGKIEFYYKSDALSVGGFNGAYISGWKIEAFVGDKSLGSETLPYGGIGWTLYSKSIPSNLQTSGQIVQIRVTLVTVGEHGGSAINTKNVCIDYPVFVPVVIPTSPTTGAITSASINLSKLCNYTDDCFTLSTSQSFPEGGCIKYGILNSNGVSIWDSTIISGTVFTFNISSLGIEDVNEIKIKAILNKDNPTNLSPVLKSWEISTCASQSTDILPIKLVSFTGTCRGKGVELQWETTTETNNDYFTLERGVVVETGHAPSLRWTKIATIKGAGNSNTKLNYGYFDNTTDFNTFYYRLKQTDYNGNYEYFSPIVVSCNSFDSEATVYPNPTDGKLNITGAVDRYDITDLSGRILIKSDKLTGDQIDISTLAKGTYFIHLYADEQRITQKVVKL